LYPVHEAHRDRSRHDALPPELIVALGAGEHEGGDEDGDGVSPWMPAAGLALAGAAAFGWRHRR
jgi:hypothetical protein